MVARHFAEGPIRDGPPPMEYTMAGQPPEPSFQPSGQDQALTQGRPAWQQPTYTPPAGNAGGPQPGQGSPPPPSFIPQEQGYAPQDQGYGQQDQPYTNLGPAPGAQGQEYQGYQAPGYAPASGAGVPQWQGIAGVTPAAARPR